MTSLCDVHAVRWRIPIPPPGRKFQESTRTTNNTNSGSFTITTSYSETANKTTSSTKVNSMFMSFCLSCSAANFHRTAQYLQRQRNMADVVTSAQLNSFSLGQENEWITDQISAQGSFQTMMALFEEILWSNVPNIFSNRVKPLVLTSYIQPSRNNSR